MVLPPVHVEVTGFLRCALVTACLRRVLHGLRWALMASALEERESHPEDKAHCARNGERHVVPKKATPLVAAGAERLIRRPADGLDAHAHSSARAEGGAIRAPRRLRYRRTGRTVYTEIAQEAALSGGRVESHRCTRPAGVRLR